MFSLGIYCIYANGLCRHVEENIGMGKYDRGMKGLVDEAPQDFVEWLFHGARFLEWYEPEFVGKECISDKLLLVEYEGKQYLLHIEFQKMPMSIWRSGYGNTTRRPPGNMANRSILL